jgi:ABC-type Zn uptake system ZnuABC Zn-binding protein ZnuA
MSLCRHLNRASLARIAMVALMFGMLSSTAPAPARAQSTPAAEPLKVVATFSILADWVQNVGGESIELTTIVPAGGDTHTFDPSPDQVASITEADIIFEIGLGFEPWLDDMVNASGASATRVAVSDGIEVLAFGDSNHDEHEDEEEGAHEDDGHDHGSQDPHIWGDVQNATNAVSIIEQALADADPANAETFAANAAAYSTELEALDEHIRTETSSVPEERRKLVTTHDTFGYYAHAYDFEITGTALNSGSTEGGDPSARDIAELIHTIEEAGVPAIFAENVSNNGLMETIAAEAGVELAPPLYTDALGEPGGEAGTYIDMMTWNTATIVEALS